MIAHKKELIASELEKRTGADISVIESSSGMRTAIKAWFSDLDANHGPVAELRPHGLKGHRVQLTFGRFSGAILTQIRDAPLEDIQLARALVRSISDEVEVEVPGQSPKSWTVSDGEFRITATIKYDDFAGDDAAVLATCREVMVPIMAAMAELIGYDVITECDEDDSPAIEGAVSWAQVKRRERNPRNRLLCLRIHGEQCVACGLKPREKYGDAGSIIEVHHLEPVATLAQPRPYDPEQDLVPLCPNCHRALHTRRHVPLSIAELQELMSVDDA